MRKILPLFALLFLMPALAWAAPRIAFSDLINGPKSGLGDGLGEGAIVTIWGNGLGSTQGTSKVYFKDSLGVSREAAYVYYWKAADGTSPGGPATWPSFIGMCEVAFSIPSAAADGAGKIYVEVSGTNSNEVDFYVRSTGRFWFVKSDGSDAAAGTYSAPKLTINTLTKKLSSPVVAAGDIIYVLGSYTVGGLVRFGNGIGSQLDGSANNNIALITYPGASILAIQEQISLTIRPPYWNDSAAGDFLVLSKLTGTSNCMGTNSSSRGRLVGNDFQWNGTNVPTTCEAGVIDAGADFYATSGIETISDLRVLGNNIHGFVAENVSNNSKPHITYFRVRSDVDTLTAPEIAYNYLYDNAAGPRYGIHYYDEGSIVGGKAVGDLVGTFSIHHNIVEDQNGPGINFVVGGGPADPYFNATFPTDIYNNLLIRTGRWLSYTNEPFAVHVAGQRNTGHTRIFNNTIYGYGDSTNANSAAIDIPATGSNDTAFGGTAEVRNNIFIDTLDFPFESAAGFQTSVTVNKNIWYSSFGRVAPTEDAAAITTNPNLVGGSPFDYRLSASSTNAIGAGYDASALVTDDLRGMLRGVPLDIGAFEYAEGEAVPTPTPTPTPATHRSMGAKPGLLP